MAAHGGGVAWIADAVHLLIGPAVVVEDRYGNLLARAGPGPGHDLHQPHQVVVARWAAP